MNYILKNYYKFRWNNYELVAVFVGEFDGDPMFQELKSGLRFTLSDAKCPEIEPVDEAAEWLKKYQPDLKKLAPTFMGFREKQNG